MASVGIRRRVNRRTGRVSYQVWWLLDDGSQGAETMATKDQARALAAEMRLQFTRDTWQGRRCGRLPFTIWADQWWVDWSADPHRSPHTLVMVESRLRNHLRSFPGDRAIEKIGPAEIRRWQHSLPPTPVTPPCSNADRCCCAFSSTPSTKAPPTPTRSAKSPCPSATDPDQVLGQARRRGLTPSEAGQLLARFPLFWWDHVLTLLGIGLRFGELAGLRRRLHLDRTPSVLQVVDIRYQAGRFGSGFKPRPKSDAGIREVLACTRGRRGHPSTAPSRHRLRRAGFHRPRRWRGGKGHPHGAVAA